MLLCLIHQVEENTKYNILFVIASSLIFQVCNAKRPKYIVWVDVQIYFQVKHF